MNAFLFIAEVMGFLGKKKSFFTKKALNSPNFYLKHTELLIYFPNLYITLHAIQF